MKDQTDAAFRRFVAVMAASSVILDVVLIPGAAPASAAEPPVPVPAPFPSAPAPESPPVSAAVPAPPPSGVELGATFSDAFFLRTPDGRFKLRVGGMAQADGRWFPDNTFAGPVDNFLARSVRLELEGTLFGIIDFRILPDFGQGQLRLQDAWTEIRFHPALRLRAGKFKVPFGLERLVSEGRTAFMERAFPTGISPNRELGVMLHGEIADGALLWAAGVFNGGVDNGTDDRELDADKEVAARLFFHPLRPAKIAALRDLGVGGAFSYGQLTGTPAAPQLGTLQTDGLNTFFRFAAPATATADDTTLFAGQRWRATAHGYHYFWRIGVFGEYVWNRQAVRIGPNHPTVTFQAWQGYLTFLLTDDRASFSGVKPKRPFDLKPGGTGAWEIGFRYSGISVSDEAFAAYVYPADANPGPNPAPFQPADASRSARGATSYTAGLNWYLNANVRLQLNYARTDFTGGNKSGTSVADRPSENVLMGRLQVLL